MYAISSVNEGKYRVLSDSLFAAFRGAPRTMEPIQVGEKQAGSGADPMIVDGQAPLADNHAAHFDPADRDGAARAHADHRCGAERRLASVAAEVEQAMEDLVERELIVVRRHGTWVEVEIRTDILFPSGIATLSPPAEQVLTQLAQTLEPFPNSIRVEGHTDNRPINTGRFSVELGAVIGARRERRASVHSRRNGSRASRCGRTGREPAGAEQCDARRAQRESTRRTGDPRRHEQAGGRLCG